MTVELLYTILESVTGFMKADNINNHNIKVTTVNEVSKFKTETYVDIGPINWNCPKIETINE
jgi:hypothetical protein